MKDRLNGNVTGTLAQRNSGDKWRGYLTIASVILITGPSGSVLLEGVKIPNQPYKDVVGVVTLCVMATLEKTLYPVKRHTEAECKDAS